METNNVNSNRDSNNIVWGGLINEFLWLCAGVDRKILRQCPTDYAKYAGIGGTILFTALMATLSGGYAFSTVFDSLYLAIPFGVFWGILIFNLDRFMVNTMYSDGKHTISKQELKGGLPRIILAIFLGIVISAPIELRIFQDKIIYQLQIDQGIGSKNIDDANAQLYNMRNDLLNQRTTYEKNIEDLRSGKTDALSSQIEQKEKDVSYLENKLYGEISGTGASKKAGEGPAAKELKKQIRRNRRELDDLHIQQEKNNKSDGNFIKRETNRISNELSNIDEQLKSVNNQIEGQQTQRKAAIKELNGLTARLVAMYELSSPSKSLILFICRLMVTFLFIAIEVIPTLFRMMMEAGPYDDWMAAERNKIKAESVRRISMDNDDVNTTLEISIAKNKDRLTAELSANKMLLDKMSKVQSELLEKAIDEWREKELVKIKEDPSSYINSNTLNDKK